MGAFLRAAGCVGFRHTLACLDLPNTSAVGKCEQGSVCAGHSPPVAAFGPHCPPGHSLGYLAPPCCDGLGPPAVGPPALPLPASARALPRPLPACLRRPSALPSSACPALLQGSVYVAALACRGILSRIRCNPIWCMPRYAARSLPATLMLGLSLYWFQVIVTSD